MQLPDHCSSAAHLFADLKLRLKARLQYPQVLDFHFFFSTSVKGHFLLNLDISRMGDQVVLHQTDELGPVILENRLVRNRSAVYILGILEILLGLGIIAVQAAEMIMYNQPFTPGYPISYVGIWTGIFAILTGVVQLLAGKKTISPHRRRRLFAVGLGTTIVCTLQAVVLFALTSYNIYLVRAEIAHREGLTHGESDEGAAARYSVENLKDLAMIRSVVALVYFSLAVLALVSAVLDCCNTCDKNGRNANAPDQVVYTSVDGNQVKQIKIYNKSHHIKA